MKAIFPRLKTHVDVREFLDVVGAVLLCLLAEGDEEFNLVPRAQVGNVAPIGQRVHVEEYVLTGVVLTLVGNEAILCREEGGGGRGRSGGINETEGGRRKGRGNEKEQEEGKERGGVQS